MSNYIYIYIYIKYTFSNGLKMFSKIYGSPWPHGLRAISHQFVGFPILKSTFVGSFWLDFGSSNGHNHGIVSRFLRPTWQNNIGPIKYSISLHSPRCMPIVRLDCSVLQYLLKNK